MANPVKPPARRRSSGSSGEPDHRWRRPSSDKAIRLPPRISRGRVSYVIGIGYRDAEFDMFGVDRARRGPLTEERIGVLRRAWTGEPFEFEGRRVQVTPLV